LIAVSVTCQDTQTIWWPNLQRRSIVRICDFRLDGMKLVCRDCVTL